MRVSPLRELFAEHRAVFSQRHGVEVVASVSDPATEYRHVREQAGLTDFSWCQCFRVPEDRGVDFLDRLVAGNVPKIRYGRVRHTFIADGEGMLLADCYVANNDEEFIVICESIVDDARLRVAFDEAGAAQAGLEDLGGTHVLLGVDGYRAWSVAKCLFGADVLGLPYLSIEAYRFEGQSVRLLRAGKTSEFGYLLLAPVAAGESLLRALHAETVRIGGGLCGVNVHSDLRLEGRFFNIHAEGVAVRDPLPLGLQWMIDFDKDEFCGRKALAGRRAAGLARKIVGVATDPGRQGLAVGSGIYDGGSKVAEVVASCFSYTLDCGVGLALLPVDMAYAGLAFTLGGAGGEAVRTISMPPIVPKSLSVRLDEL